MRDNLGRFIKGGPVNEKHPGWKGNNVSYAGIHKWLTRKLGQPKYCNNCGTTMAKKFEWANISKQYKRDFLMDCERYELYRTTQDQ